MEFRNSRSEALFQPYHFKKDSMTQAQFGFDCDINYIVKGMTAALPTRNIEVSDEVKVMTPDIYEKALYTKAAAENAFHELPSNLREQFGNNPAKMLEFVSNPDNTQKCIELGLMSVRENTSLKDVVTAVNSLNKTGVMSDKTVEAVTSDTKSQGD